jgi:MFS family permease
MPEEIKVFGMKPENGRWIFVVLGFLINLCLGSVYAYSVFKKPVEKLFNIKGFASNLPFMIFLAFFAVTMFFGGRLMKRYGHKKVAIAGGIIVGLGWISSFFAGDILFLTITYGVIAGSGVGLIYGCPIAISANWFPDRKGLAVGLTVAGFGGSPFITAYVAKKLIDSYGANITFLYMGTVFLILTVLFSIPLRMPSAGWKPAGWIPSAVTASSVDLDTKEMIRTGAFWGLLSCFMFGSLAGLMAIGISSTVGTEIIKIDPVFAASLVGIFAIFNGLGRPIFGIITDKLNSKAAIIINLSIILLMSIGMLRAVEGSILLFIICFIGFWICLGGWLAIAPTTTATFFGIKNYANNYGIVFMAYGIGAILGGIISGQAKDVFDSYMFAFYPTAGLAALGIILSLILIKQPVKK